MLNKCKSEDRLESMASRIITNRNYTDGTRGYVPTEKLSGAQSRPHQTSDKRQGATSTQARERWNFASIPDSDFEHVTADIYAAHCGMLFTRTGGMPSVVWLPGCTMP
jgi:hypothetical protein